MSKSIGLLHWSLRSFKNVSQRNRVEGMSFHLYAGQVKGLDVGEFSKAVKRWILNNEPRTKYEFDMKMVEGMVEYQKEQLIDKEVIC